jgi:hypothetical protein
MAKTRPAKSQAERNRRHAGRCWPGYAPTPGKKPGTKGSCKPKSKPAHHSVSHHK